MEYYILKFCSACVEWLPPLVFLRLIFDLFRSTFFKRGDWFWLIKYTLLTFLIIIISFAITVILMTSLRVIIQTVLQLFTDFTPKSELVFILKLLQIFLATYLTTYIMCRFQIAFLVVLIALIFLPLFWLFVYFVVLSSIYLHLVLRGGAY